MDQLLQVSRIEAGAGGKSVVLAAAAIPFNVGVSNPCPPCSANGGNSPQNNDPNAQILAENPVPLLISMSPTEIALGNDLALTLSANNFNPTSTLNFGGAQVESSSVSLTSLIVNIPRTQLTGGDVPISVTNPGPGGGTTDVLIFKVISQPNPPPVVTTVTPGSVNSGVGAVTIQVTGTAFVAATTAGLAGVPGIVSGDNITFALPAALTQDPSTLAGLVTNAGPGGGTASFSVNVLNGPLTITDFTPTSANAGSTGVPIQVTGTNFRSGSSIIVGGTPIPTVFVSSIRLDGTIPEPFLQFPSAFRIGVTNPPPGGGSVEGALFSVNIPTFSLASLSPFRAIRRASLLNIQLTGTGFFGNSAVFAGSTRLDSVFNSATSLTATIPAALMGTPGFLNIAVTNPLPFGGTTAPQTFTVENLTAVLATVSPNSIPADKTDAVLRVTGQDFVPGAVGRLVAASSQRHSFPPRNFRLHSRKH